MTPEQAGSGGLLLGGELVGEDGTEWAGGVNCSVGDLGSGGGFWKVLMKFCS